MKQTLIYALRDPKTDEYRYIGKSTSGIDRARSHLTFSHNESVNVWVEELRSEALAPAVDILEECFEDELVEKEKFWIQHYIKAGCRLFNSYVYKGQAIEKLQAELAEEKRLLEAELEGIRQERLEISTIGGFLKSRRKHLGLKQSDLAEIVGISTRTVTFIETNTGNPSFKNVIDCLNTIGYTLYPRLRK